ncbi:histidine kinase [Paenibacillus sp.]|uniref:sensor histidine kinase n=1 Tax=Paenibacillus sp. TaxID=58172 RepID=UPI00281219AB|nr:histidine kinase [Paenibacillus sp.]
MEAGSLLQSTYTKLLVTLLCVVMPLYIVSLQINHSDAESVREGISESIRSQAHFYLSSLEQEFDQTIRFQQELGMNKDLDTLSNASEILSNEGKRSAILSVQQQLIQLKFSNRFIENTKAYIPSLGSMIAANQPYFDMSEEEYAAMRAVSDSFVSPFIYWRGRLFISYMNPLLLEGTEPPFLLSVEINIGKIKETLNQFKYNGAGGAALASFKGEWAFANEADDPVMARLIELVQGGAAEPSGMGTLVLDRSNYLYYYEPSDQIGANFVVYVPEDEVFGPLERNRRRIWYLSIFSLLLIAAISAVVYRLIHRPLRKLMVAFRDVGNGQFNTVIERTERDEFAYLYRHFNQTVRKLQELVYEVFEQKYRTQHAELKQLQSQINPHFLYNSFFTIFRMAKLGDTELIQRFTQYLAEYYKFITRDSRELIRLSEEAAHAKTYVDIQLVRFGDRIAVRFDAIPDSFAERLVPRLILQPIIENAFIHALENKAQDGLLLVEFLERGSGLVVVVEDNGAGLTEAALDELRAKLESGRAEGETTGLANVHRRLRARYGEGAGLAVDRGAGGGLRVEMRLLNK